LKFVLATEGIELEKLIEKIRVFNKERDWDQFHSPKNLAMALNVEVSEIAEHFQWLKEEESKNLPPEKLAEIKEEIGDVMIFLLSLSDKLNINVLDAAVDKLEKNKEKYPVEKVKGKHHKYTEYE
jgi:NTP pyrophosphatase (non-canonical NTP hydrolase)